MVRTAIITGSIGCAILAGIILFNVLGAASLGTEYIKFGLALVLFLVIIVGSYAFVYWGGGRREQ